MLPNVYTVSCFMYSILNDSALQFTKIINLMLMSFIIDSTKEFTLLFKKRFGNNSYWF